MPFIDKYQLKAVSTGRIEAMRDVEATAVFGNHLDYDTAEVRVPTQTCVTNSTVLCLSYLGFIGKDRYITPRRHKYHGQRRV